jgi:hypothetical protein
MKLRSAGGAKILFQSAKTMMTFEFLGDNDSGRAAFKINNNDWELNPIETPEMHLAEILKLFPQSIAIFDWLIPRAEAQQMDMAMIFSVAMLAGVYLSSDNSHCDGTWFHQNRNCQYRYYSYGSGYYGPVAPVYVNPPRLPQYMPIFVPGAIR